MDKPLQVGEIGVIIGAVFCAEHIGMIAEVIAPRGFHNWRLPASGETGRFYGYVCKIPALGKPRIVVKREHIKRITDPDAQQSLVTEKTVEA